MIAGRKAVAALRKIKKAGGEYNWVPLKELLDVDMRAVPSNLVEFYKGCLRLTHDGRVVLKFNEQLEAEK